MDRTEPTLRFAVASTVAVWCGLAALQTAAPGCVGVSASLALAAVWVEASHGRAWPRARPRRSAAARVSRWLRRLAGTAVWIGAGWTLHSWIGWLSIATFEAMTACDAPPTSGGARCPLRWVAVVVAAPVLEERLYRDRLLPALRPHLGAPLAVVASAAGFALPHLEPLHVWAAFLTGIGLGGLRVGCGRVGPCVAAHVGLNLAAVGTSS